ncbi:MAG: hypothetical protein JXB15_18150 [Anaerolineales bacterium]|nr:hypothetical protein [Anaerolineales bacterium]
MADVQHELGTLREIIANIIYSLEIWDTLHDVCHTLDLYVEDNTGKLGKFSYLCKVASDTNDLSIIAAAEIILNSYPGKRGKPSAVDLQRLQDSLWWIKSQSDQKISTVTRYRIAECLEGKSFWGRLSIGGFFEPVLPSALGDSLPEPGNDENLYLGSSSTLLSVLLGSSQPNTIQPTRISVLNYLQRLGLAEWPDERFCLLIERMVLPEVQPPDKQNNLVELINPLLQSDSYELRQEGLQGGFPLYKVRRIEKGVSGSPKYIIFASTGPKPDIVIDDAVNMNIRVVRYADQCLIYDQPPPHGDLTWEMLVEWWSKIKAEDAEDKKTRRDLGYRLRASLQSEPEKMLFDTYFRDVKVIYGVNLPALLPQVHLHYDPIRQNERSKPVLVRQRMDFLMLLRNSVRIVIEIDGIQHYADDEGRALPGRYAEMVAEDRRIRVLGYEVYRFGGAEFINPEQANQTIVTFFNSLFDRYGILRESS